MISGTEVVNADLRLPMPGRLGQAVSRKEQDDGGGRPDPGTQMMPPVRSHRKGMIEFAGFDTGKAGGAFQRMHHGGVADPDAGRDGAK